MNRAIVAAVSIGALGALSVLAALTPLTALRARVASAAPPEAPSAAPSATPNASAAPYASATPSAAPSADPSASAAAAEEAAPALSIADWIPPEERSPAPKADEWEKATPLALVRPHRKCKASAVREWLRLSCLDTLDTFRGVRPLGGSEVDVSLTNFKTKNAEKNTVNGVHIILPVRRGDRRVLAMNDWESGGWKSFVIVEDTDFILSELWLPNDRGPVITVH